jgi:phage N-6-adenine-methyltransferase
MNTDLMFSSKVDSWSTPRLLFENLNKQFNFSLDVCALDENAKCEKYYTPEIDGLSQDWEGVCWMNPPYGREITSWISKAYNEAVINGNCTVVALLPARTDTKWFHNYIYLKKGVDIQFIKGRLHFGDGKNPAPFPSMLVTFRKTFEKN